MKRRHKRRSYWVYILIIIVLSIIIIFPNTKDNPLDKAKAEDIKTEQEIIQKRAEIDIQKQIYEEQSKNAAIFLDLINTKTEFLLSTNEGTATQKIDKTPNSDGFFDWRNSEIYVKTQYKVIMSIPISLVSFNVDEKGTVNISYNDNDITVKAIETQDTIVEEKAWFGKAFTEEEKTAIRELIKDRIRDTYNEDKQIKDICKQSLKDTIMELAQKFGVHCVQFNNDTPDTLTFNYIDDSNVAYGWNKDKSVNEVKYIVLHSTSNLEKDGLTHVHWLNNDPKASAVHFYIDDQNVIKTLDTTKYAYGLKNNGGKEIHNDNSIQIEICEFSDPARQEKAIKNTEDFVANTLLPLLKEQGYNPKVVTHYDATGKNCPRIFFDGVGTEWNDIKSILNI